MSTAAGRVTNVVMAGLGGQGVITASDILSEAAFLAGHDVKKAEVHGMSQRGGSVTSDVRFGGRVLSPMVPAGEADFLVVLEETQQEPTQHYLRPGGRVVSVKALAAVALPNSKAMNVAMLGLLSAFLDIPVEAWQQAIRLGLPPKLHDVNLATFALGRAAGEKERDHAGILE